MAHRETKVKDLMLVGRRSRGQRSGPAKASRAKRFGALFLVALASVVGFVGVRPREGLAQTSTVPIGLQADLLAKVAGYDRNFAARAGERAHIWLITKANDSDSLHMAKQMQAALGRLDAIGSLPHDEVIHTYTGAAELAASCKANHVALVFFGPGFGSDVGDIRKALTGADVLSATSVPDFVPDGIVLGFDVISGRPKLLVHLTQAKAQNVDFRADVLKLMKVFE